MRGSRAWCSSGHSLVALLKAKPFFSEIHHASKLSPELRALIGYSKGGYVLGFYSDPDDESGRHESVSPENMFSQRAERFGAIEGANHVVSSSMK